MVKLVFNRQALALTGGVSASPVGAKAAVLSGWPQPGSGFLKLSSRSALPLRWQADAVAAPYRESRTAAAIFRLKLKSGPYGEYE